jgi:hypothetical protein
MNGKLFAFTVAGTLYQVDPSTGAFRSIGNSGVSAFYDFGSTLSGLYAVDATKLYAINPATGAATLIGPTGVNQGSFSGLSTNSSTLYFPDGPDLYTIDTSTGTATLVGNMGGPQMGAMVFQSGTLYGGQVSPLSRIDTVDPSTGAAATGPNISGASGIVFGLAPSLPEPGFWSFVALLPGALLFRPRSNKFQGANSAHLP